LRDKKGIQPVKKPVPIISKGSLLEPQPFYGPFSRDHPGEPVPEENFWRTLWCKGRLTEADTPTIRLGATNQCQPPPSPIFYRPDALPPNQQCQSTESNGSLLEQVEKNWGNA